MGKKRDAIIKSMGKKDQKWPENVKEAYDKVIKANDILNEYAEKVRAQNKKFKVVVERLSTLDKAMDFFSNFDAMQTTAVSVAKEQCKSAGIDIQDYEDADNSDNVLFPELTTINSETTIDAAVDWAKKWPNYWTWYNETKKSAGGTARVALITDLYNEFVKLANEWEEKQK